MKGGHAAVETQVIQVIGAVTIDKLELVIAIPATELPDHVEIERPGGLLGLGVGRGCRVILVAGAE
ncbi:hypothetical protein WL1483_686 [Aeromonas schubertii]|uniref:Uncharacterized protein n=1 Tax=Aeromonas schubertii TaxID=652 RepID=A0A0S2SEH0_9GAMM|nr:hypothetical protein WL1483_686 [Aeromonas schubertii]